jgi:transcriptional regulator with XRE-family HTH domain
MAEREVGRKLRELRVARELRQTDLAQAVSGIDAVVVSRWENGEGLRRFVRHAPRLVELLGPEIWPLVYEAAYLLHHGADWEWVGPVAKVFTDLLREHTEQVPGRMPPVTWRFSYPTLDEIAARLGKSGPLSLMDQLHVSDLIFCTAITRGWPLPPASAQAGSRARRRAQGRSGRRRTER